MSSYDLLAGLESGQVAVERSVLQVVKDLEDVGMGNYRLQFVVQGGIGNLCRNASLAGITQGCESRNRGQARVGGNGNPILYRLANQGSDVLLFRFDDIRKWVNVSKLGNHTVKIMFDTKLLASRIPFMKSNIAASRN
jgi:hypothetical protein